VNEFLSEFPAGGRTWSGALASVTRLAVRPASTAGFFVTSAEAFTLRSQKADCRASFLWLDRAATASSSTDRVFQQAACDGLAAQYQLTPVAGSNSLLSVTGLPVPATRSEVAGSKVYRVSGAPDWRVAPQYLEVDVTTPPVNAANQQPEIGPGTLASITGAGLAAPGAEPAVEIAGTPATVVQASPFSLSFLVPPDLPAGNYILGVSSPLGAAQVPLAVLPFAPAIFESAAGPLLRLEDDSAVSTDNPARRGRLLKIYATGLGPLRGNSLESPLEVVFDEQVASPLAVAAVSDLPGVYEVRVAVPNGAAPSARVQLLLRLAGWPSKAVPVPVE
jgi:uncharacterized protein (TIGR03437 family)